MNPDLQQRPYGKVAIVGVGLIGGSVGLTLRGRKLAALVVGVGRGDDSVRRMAELGCVDAGTTDLAAAVEGADVVVVCAPVDSVAEQVIAAARHSYEGCLITDAGSTKAAICTAVAADGPAAAKFVGAHPLAGSQRSGPEAASADLLPGRVCVLTDQVGTADIYDPDYLYDETGRKREPEPPPEPSPRCRAAEAFWRSLGMDVRRLTAYEHDRMLGLTSHLPHLVAAALVNTVPESYHEFAGTGLADSTRIAAGDAALWRAIVESNPDPIRDAVEQFRRRCVELLNSLVLADWDRLEQFLADAKRRRDVLGSAADDQERPDRPAPR